MPLGPLPGNTWVWVHWVQTHHLQHRLRLYTTQHRSYQQHGQDRDIYSYLRGYISLNQGRLGWTGHVYLHEARGQLKCSRPVAA